jgi:hypothetical protein
VEESAGNYPPACGILSTQCEEAAMGKAIILWILGVPISVIVLIALFTNWL